MTTSVIQFGRNCLISVESIDTIRGDDKTHVITLEYGGGDVSRNVRVKVKPQYFNQVMVYCRRAINEPFSKVQWEAQWEQEEVKDDGSDESDAEEDVEPPNNNHNNVALPEHIHVGNRVIYFRSDGIRELVTIQSIDHQRGLVNVLPEGVRHDLIKPVYLRPIRAKRNQPEPNWMHRPVLYLSNVHGWDRVLSEGTIVGTVPDLRRVVIQDKGNFVSCPYESVYMVMK